jgi:hypothetical protein
MKFEQQNVWTDSNGETLLRQVNPGEWQVVPSTVNVARLVELCEAIEDALIRHDESKPSEKESVDGPNAAEADEILGRKHYSGKVGA